MQLFDRGQGLVIGTLIDILTAVPQYYSCTLHKYNTYMRVGTNNER